MSKVQARAKAERMAKAKSKGYDARVKEKHPSTNPYNTEYLFRAWLEGWTELDSQITDQEILARQTTLDPTFDPKLMQMFR